MEHGDKKVRFGVFQVDFRARELRKHGVRIKLEDQPFEILLTLIERPGEVVTRSELQARLWPDGTFVDFEKSLTKAVNKLRTALGDSATIPRFVETLSRRGYRFVAPVEEFGEEPAAVAAAAPPAPRKRRRPFWVISIVACAIGLTAAIAGLSMGKFQGWPRLVKSAPHIESLAVLPIQNLSGDPAQEYFADGLTDVLISSLARIESLRVISQTSAMRYKGAKKTVPEIARELKVDAVVEGSAARSADRAQIRIRLIHGPTDRQIWTESYEGEAGHAAALQGRIALAVAHQISARVTAETRSRLSGGGAVNARAYAAYLRGRSLWNRRGTQNILEARGYFEQALREDPNFALAYSGLADSYIIGWGVKPDVALAGEFARKALALDPNLAEAYVSLAFVYLSKCRYAEAERELKRALELGPGYVMAHQIHALYLLTMGRAEEALAANDRALEIDPFSLPVNNLRGYILVGLRQYDRALQHLRFLTELAPEASAPAQQVARVYWIRQMGPEAVAAERNAALLSTSQELPQRQGEVEAVYKSSGVRAACLRAAQLRERARRPPAVGTRGSAYPLVVLLYACAGDTAKVLELLERGLDSDDYGKSLFLKTAPELDYLRADPRFRDLLRKYGLPE